MRLLFASLAILSDSGVDSTPFDKDDFIAKIFPNGMIDFVIQLLGFVVLLLIVFFIAYKPVHNLIKRRHDYIEGNLRESEASLAKAREAESHKEETILQGKKEAARIVAEAREQANREAIASKQATAEAIEKAKKDADLEIEASKRQAEKEVGQKAIDLAIAASSAILGREVTDVDQQKLLDEMIDKLGDNNG